MVNPGEHGKNKNLLLEDDMVSPVAKCRGNQQLKACRRQAQWQEALCLFHRFRAGGRFFFQGHLFGTSEEWTPRLETWTCDMLLVALSECGERISRSYKF